MKNINIRFSITSLDSELSYNIEGEYKNQRIKFIDNEGNNNYIIKHGNILEYYKKGDVDMKYKFDLDQVTKGTYIVMGNKFEFDIVTNELIIDDEHIHIKYDLYQSKELVNKTTLDVLYQVKEESQ